ncbi:MAG TPA: SDR family oxidoreductase [Pirellulales bacterium]|jgi:short-subunit dehydrogenase|nr:SDR family oxidoreductase [Pirellulales bacterium]
MSENVLILGATSGIAKELARVLAERGCGLVLAGRNRAELERSAADLRLRYHASADVEIFDAMDFAGHGAFIARCLSRPNPIDGVVLCYGYLPDQRQTEIDADEARRTIDLNLTSAIALLVPLANYLESRRSGYLAVISSVAGDRGRPSNYTYGASKAGVTAYVEGLAGRLHRSGVHVLTVKPGFVDTPMIQGRIDPSSPLVASPKRVARDIDRAIRWRRNTIYTPWFWRPILLAVRLMPQFIFKRLRL